MVAQANRVFGPGLAHQIQARAHHAMQHSLPSHPHPEPALAHSEVQQLLDARVSSSLVPHLLHRCDCLGLYLAGNEITYVLHQPPIAKTRTPQGHTCTHHAPTNTRRIYPKVSSTCRTWLEPQKHAQWTLVVTPRALWRPRRNRNKAPPPPPQPQASHQRSHRPWTLQHLPHWQAISGHPPQACP